MYRKLVSTVLPSKLASNSLIKWQYLWTCRWTCCVFQQHMNKSEAMWKQTWNQNSPRLLSCSLHVPGVKVHETVLHISHSMRSLFWFFYQNAITCSTSEGFTLMMDVKWVVNANWVLCWLHRAAIIIIWILFLLWGKIFGFDLFNFVNTF